MPIEARWRLRRDFHRLAARTGCKPLYSCTSYTAAAARTSRYAQNLARHRRRTWRSPGRPGMIRCLSSDLLVVWRGGCLNRCSALGDPLRAIVRLLVRERAVLGPPAPLAYKSAIAVVSHGRSLSIRMPPNPDVVGQI